MKSKASMVLFCMTIILSESAVFASQVSTGPGGIHSSGLGLTGNGVGIGQVDVGRPGDPASPNGMPFDTAANLINTFILPAEVFYTTVDPVSGAPNFTATANAASEIELDAQGNVTPHSTLVAGVMISRDTTVVNSDTAVGVAPQANLFATGLISVPTQNVHDVLSVAAQHIATRDGGNIHAINLSFGLPLASQLPDGTSLFSSFVDWSARVHDVLYVTAGPEISSPDVITPTDNFNGITVAYSKKDTSGKYRIVDDDNVFTPNPLSPFTERTFTDLLAPGQDITMASQGNVTGTSSGTSFAAPHVTGTVALLQEHANTQIGNSVPGWDGDARRHQVMKAVLMNSADKVSGRLGSTRTVLKKNGDTWDDSDAAFDIFLPLDEEMGAGHLNAKRAFDQYSPGESDPDGASVPVVGWDFDTTTGLNDVNKYVLNQELLKDSYISITLAWDREVTFASGGGDGRFDSGDTFNGYS